MNVFFGLNEINLLCFILLFANTDNEIPDI